MYDNVDDTLIGHHAFGSHLPQRLDQVVSEYCDAAPWKMQHGMRDAGEKGAVIERMGGEELTLYNGQDCRLTALAWERMQPDLKREEAVYRHDLQLARICHEMTWVGIGVDPNRRDELIGACRDRAESLKGAMRQLCGDLHFAPSKTAHVRRVLYSSSLPGLKLIRKTPSGLPSTDNETLESLRGETELGKFAYALLQWRVVEKVRSTYLDAVKINGDTGRAHYGWKPYGTVSGRLACRLQSCPRWSARRPESRPREIYVPSRGNVFVYFDVSQAEMRLAAYLAADPVFMGVASGSDVHAGNAKTVFPEVAAKGWLDDKAAKADPERGKKFRDIAKNLGFAISYGAEAEKVYVTLTRKGFKVTMSAVELILAKLKSAYRVYYDFVKRNVQVVQRDGYMRSPIMGRIRWFGWFPKPTDIANYPVQSALADVVNLRTIAMAKTIQSNPRLRGIELVAQVHDACTYDCPIEAADELEESIRTLWAESISLKGGDLVLPIDMKRGERWSEF